jgi:3-phenylpropionate/cinnamic acid dioxygenase small subunit
MSTDWEILVRVIDYHSKYARALDTLDVEALAAMVVDDVKITRPWADGTRVGREDFIAYQTEKSGIADRLAKHYLTNIEARRDPSGMVISQAYYSASIFWPERTQMFFGEIHDELRDEGDRLLIVHKQILLQRVLELPAAQGNTLYQGQDAMALHRL